MKRSERIVYDYEAVEVGTGKRLASKHASEVYNLGDKVDLYTYEDSSKGHFKTGFDAFVSDDRHSHGMSLSIAALVFLLLFGGLASVFAISLFKERFGTRKP